MLGNSSSPNGAFTVNITSNLLPLPGARDIVIPVRATFTHNYRNADGNGLVGIMTEQIGTIVLTNGGGTTNAPTPPTPPTPPTLSTIKPKAIVGWSRWPFGFSGNKPPPPVVPISVSNNRPVLINRNALRRMIRIGIRPF